MKILITGKKGQLGRALSDQLCPAYKVTTSDRNDLDICNEKSVNEVIRTLTPDIIINAAAYTAVDLAETHASDCWAANAQGPLYLARAAAYTKARLIHFSTDYVFDGEKGSYSTKDPINPVNKYAITKAAGELAVRVIDKNLVIRTSFCENEFPYPKAFKDQYTSRDYVDVIAPLIYNEAVSSKVGVVHVGTQRKSVYDLARMRKSNVGQISINDVDFSIPKDTSFED